MEQARQQAFKMKDELVLGYKKIRDEFYRDFDQKDRIKPTHVKQPNGTYKIVKKLDMKPAWISEPEGKEWLQKVDVFFEHLANDLKDTNTSLEEIRDEVFIILRTVNKDGEPATIDPVTCSKEAFVIYIIRKCLKDEKFQMQYSTNWKYFGKEFAKYVMDTIPNA